MTDLTYVENMRVAQAKISEGDVRWYVVNAANHVVRGPFTDNGDVTSRELADGALKNIRDRALEEAADEELERHVAMVRQPIGRDAA